MEVTFKQGEDIIIPVSVIKGGVALNLTSCPNIKAILKVNNVEQKKYALVPEVGFGKLEVDGVETNKVKITVERDDSKSFPVGNISIILLTSFTDANYADSKRVEEYKFQPGRVLQGEGTSETI